MTQLAQGISRLFDLVIGPLASRPALALIAVSVLTAVWALLLFKATTRQKKLTVQRDRLFGHIYEMGLYQDHLRVMGRIQWDLARANLRYLALTLPALVVLTVPMIVTLAQLDSRFAHRPLGAGETTVLSVRLDDAAPVNPRQLSLEVPAGVRIEAGPVVDRPGRAAAWRLKLDEPGPHRLVVRADGREAAERILPAPAGLPQLSEEQKAGWTSPWLRPGAAALPADSPLASTKLDLPERETKYAGVPLHWLLAFMVFSLLGGLLLKDALRVSI